MNLERSLRVQVMGFDGRIVLAQPPGQRRRSREMISFISAISVTRRRRREQYRVHRVGDRHRFQLRRVLARERGERERVVEARQPEATAQKEKAPEAGQGRAASR